VGNVNAGALSPGLSSLAMVGLSCLVIGRRQRRRLLTVSE
jgi:hypothetical protein